MPQRTDPAEQLPGSAPGMRAFFWIRDLAISATLAILMVLFVYQPVRVEGFSMAPRLENNERLVINKLAYRFEPIRRGDVIVFWYPRNTRESFIKRVIGLPGDRVQMLNGVVYINGVRLHEPYVDPAYRGHGYYPATVVPAGAYFVLGDHRDSSSDSRIWGFVPRDLIYGKASFAYWPLQMAGEVH